MVKSFVVFIAEAVWEDICRMCAYMFVIDDDDDDDDGGGGCGGGVGGVVVVVVALCV